MLFLNRREQRISSLIGDIYEAAYRPGHWNRVLDRLRRHSWSPGATLLYRDKRVGSASIAYARGWPERVVREYDQTWGARDPLFELYTSKYPNGTIAACYQMEPDRKALEAVDQEYFNWIKSNGGHYAAGAIVFDDGERQAALTVQRPRFQGRWAQKHLNFLADLMPHVSRALTIHGEFARLRACKTALEMGLEKLGVGVVLFDDLGEALYTNAIAREIIDKHPALSMVNNRLVPVLDQDRIRLQSAIAIASRISYQIRDGSAGRELQREECLALGAGGSFECSLPAMVMPAVHAIGPDGDKVPQVASVMFLGDMDFKAEPGTEELRKRYGLSPAEVRLARLLVDGYTLSKAAGRLTVSHNTVKTQLQSIFRKTGTSRQSELLKKLLTDN